MSLLLPAAEYKLSSDNHFKECIDRRAEASSAIYKLRVASLCGHVPVEVGTARKARVLTGLEDGEGSAWLTVVDQDRWFNAPSDLPMLRTITLTTHIPESAGPVDKIETSFALAQVDAPGVIGTHDCGRSSCQYNSPSLLDAEIIDPEIRSQTSAYDVNRFVTDALTLLVAMERASLEVFYPQAQEA